MATVAQNPLTDSTDSTDSTVSPEEMKKMIKESIQKSGAGLSKERKQELANLLKKIYVDKKSPMKVFGIKKEELGEMYQYAFHEFKSGNMAFAREIFKVLLKFDPNNTTFALSLGVCHHQLKDYQLAIPMYLLATWTDRTNPVPFFYAYDCFLKQDNEFAALMMLYNAVAAAGDNPKYAVIKSKSQALLAALEQKMQEKQNNPTKKG